MTASLAQLLAVRSRFVEEIDAFCRETIQRLDSTGFFYKGNAGESQVISISRTGVDARVFTRNRKPKDKDRGGGGRDGDDESAPATAHDRALAELDEHPRLTEERESIPWSRALAEAKKDQPLVIRGAPGSGKTTLSRFSTVQRLGAVRAALQDHSKLPEDCDPMIWLTCSTLAEAEGSADEPTDLVISGAFLALDLPAGHSATSSGVRGWLRARITAGGCPVVLDSLDEVETKNEAAFCARAPRLLHLGSPLLLTCRVLEWEERRKWTGWTRFTEIEMAPLNRREQREYSRRFYREEINRSDLESGIERQLAQNASLRKACESPILLCFACLLHAEGELSGAGRRTELYQRMRRRLFRGEWRGLPHPPEWADGKIREKRTTIWLSEIALALFSKAPEAKIFSFDA